jgi:hypothetical protein
MSSERELSPLEKQAVDALRRARRLPLGPHRNDLRQLAKGLLWLHRNGMDAFVASQNAPSATSRDPRAEQHSKS